MRANAPFQQDDLDELEELYEQGFVVPMWHVAAGFADSVAIGVRHDVDNHIEPAVAMAEWEAERDIRSTYFILHTAPYWHDKKLLRESVQRIGGFGHEIGFHLNAITKAIETGRDPLDILTEDIAELRSYWYAVTGVVAHGDSACYSNGQVRFVNDEIFTESARPDYGAPDRTVAGVKLNPMSRTEFGFDYDPNWLPRAAYLSDSGGRWSQPFEQVTAGYPYAGQLHMLIHPDWWTEAFAKVSA